MKKARVGKVLNIVVLVCVIIIFLLIIMFALFVKDVFQYKTSINGIDCSFLNIPSSKQKLEKEMNNSSITLKFADDKEYVCLGAYFNFKINDTDTLLNIMQKQKDGENREIYNLSNLFKIDENKVKEYLSSLSVFNKSSTRKPQNAYLEWNEEDKSFYIKPEVYGNELSFDAAYDYMINELKNGKTIIDFTEITNINPKILSNDKNLKTQMDKINSILTTTINYKLHDGSTYTLDYKTMKNWVIVDDDGNYSIDIDNNVSKFVDTLNEKASYQLTSTKFNATGLGKISIAFGRKTYANINEEKEIDRIKSELKNPGKKSNWEVIYNSLPDYTNLSTYVELDLSRQRVWMYVNGRCILNTPCVTGNVSGGYSTPVGIYHLTYKTMNTTVEGYNSDGSKYSSPVTFWMPFNGGIGFHDASWRSNFGGNIYMTNGSHGCVNLPYSAAQTVYNNINTSIPIILYAS